MKIRLSMFGFIVLAAVLAFPFFVLAQTPAPAPAPSFDLLGTLVPAVGSLLIALLSWVAVYAANLIKAKVANTYLQGVLVRLDDAVYTAVKMVTQTYVDAIKEASADGTLTADEKMAAKQKAIDAVKDYLGAKGLATIAQVLGLTGSAVDSFLGAKIEAAVATTKPPSPN